MSKGNKVFWVVLSIVFAIGSVVIGSMYEAKKTKELNASITQSTETTSTQESAETKKDDQSSPKENSSSSEKKDTSKKEEDSEEEVTEVTSTAGQNAQQLIDVIIVNGQVQSDFTLDEYYVAKNAVDALPAGGEKKLLNKEITQIETALKNMGISY